MEVIVSGIGKRYAAEVDKDHHLKVDTKDRIKRFNFRKKWVNGEGHAPKSKVIDVSGTITRVIMEASSATGNPTVTLTMTEDILSATIFAPGAKADGATYVFDTAMDVDGLTTISIDPSADSSTVPLIVDVVVYVSL